MSHLNIEQFESRRAFEQAQADHNKKQLVVYDANENDYLVIGHPAYVTPVDHPDTYNVTNGRIVRTTVVEWYNTDTGVFETKNTRYVPSKLVA
jgi:hypothetical protein